MNIKIHYRITQDRAGLPNEYIGARRLVVGESTGIEETAKSQIARDYQVPHAAVEIIKIED